MDCGRTNHSIKQLILQANVNMTKIHRHYKDMYHELVFLSYLKMLFCHLLSCYSLLQSLWTQKTVVRYRVDI